MAAHAAADRILFIVVVGPARRSTDEKHQQQLRRRVDVTWQTEVDYIHRRTGGGDADGWIQCDQHSEVVPTGGRG